MNRFGLRNNQLKLKIAGVLPVSVEESMGIYLELIKENTLKDHNIT